MLNEIERDSSAREPQLTPREYDVLFITARGFTQGEIGKQLGIGVNTVEAHVTSIHRKFNVGLGSGRTAKAVFKAVELGILDLDEIVGGFKLDPETHFTPRELEVLELMVRVDGKAGNGGVADALFIQTNTVEFHKTGILRKLGTRSSIQAGLRYLAAKRDGLI